MTLTPGQILDGKYRIVRLIGEGGMGSVFEGENSLIARRVAIKVLHAAAAQNAQMLTRFEREAQAAGRIGSDHILEILDLGRLEGGDRYMVMEFLDGEVLADRIAKAGHLTPEESYPILRQTLVGLAAAHSAGIVHRDLKPENIFILREKAGHKDFVKIIDFGISKFSTLSSEFSMTTTGAVMGTPYYMSPEQAKGGTVDARTDLYAAGVILFEALTGAVPFSGTSFNDLMFKIVLADIPPLPETIDPGFAAIVRTAMARNLEERFQTAAEFLSALDDWAETRGVSRATTAGESRAKMPTFTDETSAAARAKTAANWAATQGDEAPPAKKGIPLAAIAAAAVLAIGGGAFALLSRGAEPEATPATVAEAPVDPSAGRSVPGSAAPAPPVAASSAVSPAGSAGRVAAPSSVPAVDESSAVSKPESATASNPESATKPQPAARPQPTARPTSSPPSTATKPPAKPTRPSAAPDFGY